MNTKSNVDKTSAQGQMQGVGTEDLLGGADAHGWIKVAEKMPDPGFLVWVSAGGGTCLIARHMYRRWHAAAPMLDCPIPFVPTHWQHLVLPKPPIDSPNVKDETRAGERACKPSELQ